MTKNQNLPAARLSASASHRRDGPARQGRQDLRTILKFDVGADGFKKMIYVLAAGALIVLTVGIYFINLIIKEVRHLS